MSSYQQIDLSDYIRTGEGGTAVSYTHKKGHTLAKLYNPGFEADRAEAEFQVARTVFEMGIPTPEPFRLVTDGERYGAEYELIPGKRSFTRIISQEPGRMEEISLAFARMSRQLHDTKADTTRLRSYRQAVESFYREKDLVPEDYKQRALAFLEKVPDKPICLHGDLHIGNIITDGQRTLWIDVGEFAYGVPEWDLGVMWTLCHNMDKARAEHLLHLSPEALTTHWDIFLPAYLGTADKQTLQTFTKQVLPYYAVKVPYVYDMAYHTAFPQEACQKLIGLL
ncbi:MAG: TIGR02172 family protein [Bacteroidales bacterium]|nr:TIGR02172 family protein [Bacteroidales bacterium]